MKHSQLKESCDVKIHIGRIQYESGFSPDFGPGYFTLAKSHAQSRKSVRYWVSSISFPVSTPRFSFMWAPDKS